MYDRRVEIWKNNEAKRKLKVIVIVWEGRNIERRKECSYFQDNRLSSTGTQNLFCMKQSLKKNLIVGPQNYEILVTVTIFKPIKVCTNMLKGNKVGSIYCRF